MDSKSQLYKAAGLIGTGIAAYAIMASKAFWDFAYKEGKKIVVGTVKKAFKLLYKGTWYWIEKIPVLVKSATGGLVASGKYIYKYLGEVGKIKVPESYTDDAAPTQEPTQEPTPEPSSSPTPPPTFKPTFKPTSKPTFRPLPTFPPQNVGFNFGSVQSSILTLPYEALGDQIKPGFVYVQLPQIIGNVILVAGAELLRQFTFEAIVEISGAALMFARWLNMNRRLSKYYLQKRELVPKFRREMRGQFTEKELNDFSEKIEKIEDEANMPETKEREDEKEEMDEPRPRPFFQPNESYLKMLIVPEGLDIEKRIEKIEDSEVVIVKTEAPQSSERIENEFDNLVEEQLSTAQIYISIIYDIADIELEISRERENVEYYKKDKKYASQLEDSLMRIKKLEEEREIVQKQFNKETMMEEIANLLSSGDTNYNLIVNLLNTYIKVFEPYLMRQNTFYEDISSYSRNFTQNNEMVARQLRALIANYGSVKYLEKEIIHIKKKIREDLNSILLIITSAPQNLGKERNIQIAAKAKILAKKMGEYDINLGEEIKILIDLSERAQALEKGAKKQILLDLLEKLK